MGNSPDRFLREEKTPRFYFSTPAEEDNGSYLSQELESLIEESLLQGTELTVIQESKGGVIAIVPKHLAVKLVWALNLAADTCEAQDFDGIMKPRKKQDEDIDPLRTT